MAIASTTIAALSLAATGISTVVGVMARQDAQDAANRSAEEQRKVQAEQRAQNAAQAANERRQQVREERVRRARVLQSAENTGVDQSSGEFGALGSLSTNLGSNIGSNLGRLTAANNMSIFSQNAANFNLQAQNLMFRANAADQLASFSGNIFSASGGFDALTPKFQPNRTGIGTNPRANDFSPNMQLYGI